MDMQKLKLLSLAIITSTALVGCSTLFNSIAKKNLNQSDATFELAGIQNKVEIRRDSYGVPFIEAQSLSDLAFGMGYAMAEDRLAQMVSMNLLSRGRLSEMAGPAAVSMDKYMRTLGVPSIIQQRYQTVSPSLKANLEQFALGVNAYLQQHQDSLPIEFKLAGYTPEPWQADNTIGLFVVLNLGVGFNLHEELAFLQMAEKLGSEKAAYLAPIYPDENIDFAEAQKLEAIPGLTQQLKPEIDLLAQVQQQLRLFNGQGVAASNNWGVHKSHTKHNGTLIANDTHLLLTQPATWMLMGVKSPEYSGAGIGLPGIPALIAGYNGHIGWGETMVMADTQDIFLEQLRTNQDGQTEYLYQGQWRPVSQREETLQVKGDKPVTFVVQSTLHGPLLNSAIDTPAKHAIIPQESHSRYGLALAWTAQYPDNTIDAFFRLGQAKTVAEAEQALNDVRFIHLNMAVGDKDNILWQVTGNYPLRKKGTGHFPSPGWSGEYDWGEAWGGEATPRSLNPAAGYFATGNNRTVEAGFTPTLTNSWYYPERAERALQMLGATAEHDANSMIAMQADRYDLLHGKVMRLWQSEPWQRMIEQGIAALDLTQRENAQKVLERLLKFDGNMEADSADAALWGATEYQLIRHIFMDELGPEDSASWTAFMAMNARAYSGYQDHILGRKTPSGDWAPFWDDIGTEQQENPGQIIAKALAQVWPYLTKELGKDSSQWQWGQLAQYHWQTETTKMRPYLTGMDKWGAGWLSSHTDRGPYPAGGDRNTLNVAGYNLGSNYKVWNIPAMRLVVDFSQDEPLHLVIAGGQSANPASPHYDDGIELWLSRQNRVLPVNSDERVKQHYSSVLTLMPQ